MINKIVFQDLPGVKAFGRLDIGNCFVYPEPVSNQLYMKVRLPFGETGCVSLKDGKYYVVEFDKQVRPVCIEIQVSRAIGDCG